MMHPWQQRHCRWRKAVLRNLLGVEALWKQAALVQALTETEAGQWRPLCGASVRVIPNGVGTCPQERGSVKLPSRPFILYLSRLHPQKSPEVLLQAFLLLSNRKGEVDLVLAGPDGGVQSRLEKTVRQAGLEDRVHFVGSLTGLDKWEALRSCALFCLPSQGEGLSLAILEACAAGAPCLITEACGFPELVEAGGAVRVDRNPATLAARMLRILEHPDEAQAMGLQAKRLVESAYTWEQVAVRFREAMREDGT
jgi:glycosyltransferase involved in cell wall biosynthesis